MNGVPSVGKRQRVLGPWTLSPTSFNVDFGVGGVPSPGVSKAITMTAPPYGKCSPATPTQ